VVSDSLRGFDETSGSPRTEDWALGSSERGVSAERGEAMSTSPEGRSSGGEPPAMEMYSDNVAAE